MEFAPLPLIRSALLSQFPHVRMAQSTRQGEAPDAPFDFNLGYNLGDEDSRVTGNIARFAGAVDLEPEDLAFMHQVHGETIREVSEPGAYEDTDALITQQPGVGLTVRTADCVPVMLYAPAANVIAAVHAGWRGTAEHITRKTVERLQADFGAEADSIFAFIGAAAGLCCYEIGDEVAALFPERWLERAEGKPARLDLPGVNRHQLEEAGIPEANIEVCGLCSIHEQHLLHSYRRDGAQSGRMLATIVLREEE
ncbi:MAG: peptidoglycan editing factor PgeF [Bacteroidetes bacterium]|nr:peptidoglycan editing factor PgeF [Bacteroidota bacterium]